MFVCPAGMWIGLRDAAISGRPITGIMNPNSGPYADEGSQLGYQIFLRDEMGIGDGAIYHPEEAKPTVRRLAGGRGVGGCIYSHSIFIR